MSPWSVHDDAHACDELKRTVQERLPRPGPRYARRLNQELAWYCAERPRAHAILVLAARRRSMLDAGYLSSPYVHRPGGSLVAWLLDASAFDPLAWDLAFQPPRGALGDCGQTGVSGRALAELALPTLRDHQGIPGYLYFHDHDLDALERAAPRSFRWRAHLDVGIAALAVRPGESAEDRQTALGAALCALELQRLIGAKR